MLPSSSASVVNSPACRKEYRVKSANSNNSSRARSGIAADEGGDGGQRVVDEVRGDLRPQRPHLGPGQVGPRRVQIGQFQLGGDEPGRLVGRPDQIGPDGRAGEHDQRAGPLPGRDQRHDHRPGHRQPGRRTAASVASWRRSARSADPHRLGDLVDVMTHRGPARQANGPADRRGPPPGSPAGPAGRAGPARPNPRSGPPAAGAPPDPAVRNACAAARTPGGSSIRRRTQRPPASATAISPTSSTPTSRTVVVVVTQGFPSRWRSTAAGRPAPGPCATYFMNKPVTCGPDPGWSSPAPTTESHEESQ